MSLFLILSTLLICANAGFVNHQNFTENCDELKHIAGVICSAESVDCDGTYNYTKAINITENYPSEAHDFRIEPFAKTVASWRQSTSNHHLTVDISWQIPPNNNSRYLSAFLIKINGPGAANSCFLFNFTGNWTNDMIMQSPRLHFSTNSIFDFNKDYLISLYSLPLSWKKRNFIEKKLFTPQNPNSLVSGENVSTNCTRSSHPYASKWTAGFRRIYIHAIAKKIQIEFVGAPPQYCFEKYEVRLLDETASELLHSGFVSIDQMRSEKIANNATIMIGAYNFEDLQYDHVYIPSVIPVERASDGRCLCPVHESDPYEVKVVCSCVAADWKPIRINRLDIVQNIEDNFTLPVLVPQEPRKSYSDNNGTFLWFALFFLNILFCLAVAFGLFWYYGCCRKVLPRQLKGKQIGFVPRKLHKNKLDEIIRNGGSTTAQCNEVSLLDPFGGTTTVGTTTPLLLTPQMNILIVYAHDSSLHEQAVIAFAEYLRDVYHLHISLDQWDSKRIERNLVDYIAASVLDANKVLVINSLGAYERYMARISPMGYLVERDDPGPFDRHFLQQIDMVLQHKAIISARFSYTPLRDTLPQIVDSLQYIIPDNLVSLMSAIMGRNMRNDTRIIGGYSPQLEKLRSLVKMAEKFCVSDSEWFIKTHRKRLHEESPRTQLTATAVVSSAIQEHHDAEVNGAEPQHQTTTTLISVGTGGSINGPQQQNGITIPELAEKTGQHNKIVIDSDVARTKDSVLVLDPQGIQQNSSMLLRLLEVECSPHSKNAIIEPKPDSGIFEMSNGMTSGSDFFGIRNSTERDSDDESVQFLGSNTNDRSSGGKELFCEEGGENKIYGEEIRLPIGEKYADEKTRANFDKPLAISPANHQPPEVYDNTLDDSGIVITGVDRQQFHHKHKSESARPIKPLSS